MIWPTSSTSVADAERWIDQEIRPAERYTIIDRLALFAYHVLSFFA